MDVQLFSLYIYHVDHSIAVNISELKRRLRLDLFTSHETVGIKPFQSCVWVSCFKVIFRFKFLAKKVDLVVADACCLVFNRQKKVAQTVSVKINETGTMRLSKPRFCQLFRHTAFCLFFDQHWLREWSHYQIPSVFWVLISNLKLGSIWEEDVI